MKNKSIFFVLLLSCFPLSFTKESKASQKMSSSTPTVQIIYSPSYDIDLGGLEKLHAFDIKKYQKIFNQLSEDSLISKHQIHSPSPLSKEDILLIHSPSFIKSLNDPQKVATYLEAPIAAILSAPKLDQAVLAPFRHTSGGTFLAAEKSLTSGIAINIGGGYHHAKPEKGEGFCVYADVPIAIRKLQKQQKIKTALIIDLDVHQGNGTAVCLANDTTTFTFSMHQSEIYPIPKEKSDWDIELHSGDGDTVVLKKLKETLPQLFTKINPDIVFYIAGCDMLKGDPLASLTMSEEGIVQRDMMVIEACVKRKIPVVMMLSGGYSENAWHAQFLSIKTILQKFETK